MKRLTSVAALVLLALAARNGAAQIGTDATDEPPAPAERQFDAPIDQSPAARTFAEEASPADFGITATPGADGHLSVAQVVDGSTAAIAGLRAGDHIVSLDGQFITSTDDLHGYLAAHPASPITVIVLRDGVEQTILINPASPGPAVIEHSAARIDARPALGVRFVRSSEVVLTETLPESPAALAGLEPGDRLISVNGDVIASSDHFISMVAATAPGHDLTITYLRGGDRQTVVISPSAWDSIYGSSGTYVAMKPTADEAVVAPCATTSAWGYYSPYYATHMSPVGVPATAFVRYGAPYPYWIYPNYGYPYYSFSYYYPNWYYHAWPWGWSYYGGPYSVAPTVVPGHPADRREDSARRDEPANDRQIGQVTTPQAID